MAVALIIATWHAAQKVLPNKPATTILLLIDVNQRKRVTHSNSSRVNYNQEIITAPLSIVRNARKDYPPAFCVINVALLEREM